jgi:hypothetical protein
MIAGTLCGNGTNIDRSNIFRLKITAPDFIANSADSLMK